MKHSISYSNLTYQITKEDISDAWERTSSAREESAKEIEFGQEKEYVVEEYVGGQNLGLFKANTFFS